VIAIIAILATLAMNGIKSVQTAADATQCSNNLRQVNTCLLVYIQDNDQRFPRRFNETAPGILCFQEAVAKTYWESRESIGQSQQFTNTGRGTKRWNLCPSMVRQYGEGLLYCNEGWDPPGSSQRVVIG
jgi:type II secretory pathway pseudopilin PulG